MKEEKTFIINATRIESDGKEKLVIRGIAREEALKRTEKHHVKKEKSSRFFGLSGKIKKAIEEAKLDYLTIKSGDRYEVDSDGRLYCYADGFKMYVSKDGKFFKDEEGIIWTSEGNSFVEQLKLRDDFFEYKFLDKAKEEAFYDKLREEQESIVFGDDPFYPKIGEEKSKIVDINDIRKGR